MSVSVEARITDCSNQGLLYTMNRSSRVSVLSSCDAKRMFPGLISLCIKSFECIYWITEIGLRQ